MDSLTQIALGAAVGIAVAGKSHGRKAALIGAICGTIPDLDVFIDHGDPVSNFTMHRGFSHSILFAVLATPIFVWIFSKLKWFAVNFKDKSIHLAIFLCLLTHMLLDALTIYGTQLFWPLQIPPVGVGSIFIIDPFYTLPLLTGVIWFLCNKSLDANRYALIISSFYLLWSMSAQNSVRDVALDQWDGAEKPAHILVQPTPFNTVLWRIVIVTDAGYQVGYYSLFDGDREISYKNFLSQTDLLNTIAEDVNVKKLQWFSKGFYAVTAADNKIVMSDLRMGLEPDQYVFSFAVGEQTEQGAITPVIIPEQVLGVRDMSRLSRVWDRIWDENVAL